MNDLGPDRPSPDFELLSAWYLLSTSKGQLPRTLRLAERLQGTRARTGTLSRKGVISKSPPCHSAGWSLARVVRRSRRCLNVAAVVISSFQQMQRCAATKSISCLLACYELQGRRSSLLLPIAAELKAINNSTPPRPTRPGSPFIETGASCICTYLAQLASRSGGVMRPGQTRCRYLQLQVATKCY